MSSERTYFPFTAIVGQELLKDALLCNAVQPGIGGVLIAGTRGTAKSTAARSLSKLLPSINVISDCPFQCPPEQPSEWCSICEDQYQNADHPPSEQVSTPFVNLPLGATADRVMGTIDLEKAIEEGERAFEPGLLAAANRGVLYIDEVNLLGDHLVDLLLDVAAMGVNRVEREGISFEHRADVILIGTMNPEEGELRPQLLDRFGLYVEMDQEYDPEVRRKVVERRTAFDQNPDGMMREWREEEEELAGRVRSARKAYDDVDVPDTEVDRIVDICAEYRVDGMRADITMHKTARALAALDGRSEVREGDVIRAAELALGHRGQQPPQQTDPPESDDDPGSNNGSNDSSDPSERDRNEGNESSDEAPNTDPNGSNDARGQQQDAQADDASDETDDAGTDQVFPASGGIDPPEKMAANSSDDLIERTSGFGRRTEMRTTDRKGYYFRSRVPRGSVGDLALDATIRAAAPYQKQRKERADGDPERVMIRPTDYREKERKDRVRNLVVFVVDASGSMGAYERMSAVKGAILSLLEDAYQKRDLVSMIGFRQDGAEVLLSPTRSVQRAARELVDLPVGGRTPLAAGLREGIRLIERERQRRARVLPLLVLLTDGRGNVTQGSEPPEVVSERYADRIRRNDIRSLCIDTEHGFVRMNQVRPLAERMGACYEHLEQIESDAVHRMVSREMVEGGLQSWLVE